VITAVDTSVLLDVFLPDDRHGERSKQRLRTAYDDGAIIVCDIVYAELAAFFRDRDALDSTLRAINVSGSRIDASIAHEAGLRWRRYGEAGGPRKRIISDFLIGAHAMIAADAFLSRDRGFFSTYFPEMVLRANTHA